MIVGWTISAEDKAGSASGAQEWRYRPRVSVNRPYSPRCSRSDARHTRPTVGGSTAAPIASAVRIRTMFEASTSTSLRVPVLPQRIQTIAVDGKVAIMRPQWMSRPSCQASTSSPGESSSHEQAGTGPFYVIFGSLTTAVGGSSPETTVALQRSADIPATFQRRYFHVSGTVRPMVPAKRISDVALPGVANCGLRLQCRGVLKPIRFPDARVGVARPGRMLRRL